MPEGLHQKYEIAELIPSDKIEIAPPEPSLRNKILR